MAKKGMSRPTTSQYQGSGQKRKNSKREAPNQVQEQK